jgi:hypothetical protein
MFSFIYLNLLFKDVAKASVDKMKEYYKDEQNILEEKVEYNRQNIRDAEDELVDEQSILPLRCKLLDLCSNRELT